MKLVSAAKHAALQTRLALTLKELEDANKRDAERLATIKGLRTEVEQLRDDKPDSPVRQPKPATGDTELRRRLALAERTIRAQADEIARLQTSHEADTRELHDLRQGVAS